jgi:hypothetical protein
MERNGRSMVSKEACLCTNGQFGVCTPPYVINSKWHFRNAYPPYGFYILNRQGTDDYIQRLHPEDDIEAHGNYLMLRSYPHYTSHRLAPLSSTDKFDKIYAVDNLENISSAEKGRSTTIGLWMFATDSREPMIKVMLRYVLFLFYFLACLTSPYSGV